MVLAGVALLLVGFAFKVSLVPFHVWTPDVYQGAPTPITALMASVGKVAAFSALARVFLTGLSGRADDWAPAIYALAVVTLVVGSVVAVVQTDVKRMLAYSSISHAGFILVGLEAATHISVSDSELGLSSISLYLFIYSFLVIGTFAVTSAVVGDGAASVDSFKGLGKSNPVLALAMTVLLLAQAGVPATSGFIAKFGVIREAVSAERNTLAIIALIAAVVATFFYLKIAAEIWFQSNSESQSIRLTTGTKIVVCLTAGSSLAFGLFPNFLVNYVK
jgi:NADH-quinone oxidoreductase subunit N